jgi:hypothetical protein
MCASRTDSEASAGHTMYLQDRPWTSSTDNAPPGQTTRHRGQTMRHPTPCCVGIKTKVEVSRYPCKTRPCTDRLDTRMLQGCQSSGVCSLAVAGQRGPVHLLTCNSQQRGPAPPSHAAPGKPPHVGLYFRCMSPTADMRHTIMSRTTPQHVPPERGTGGGCTGTAAQPRRPNQAYCGSWTWCWPVFLLLADFWQI